MVPIPALGLSIGVREAIVVVTYAPDGDVMPRLRAHAALCERVFVVDNSAPPAFGDAHIAHCPALRLLTPGRNIGIAAALNAGVHAAIDEGFERVLLLDQDSRLTADAIAVLHEAARPDHGITAMRPRLDGGDAIESGGLPAMRDLDTCMTSGSLLNLEAFRRCGDFRDELFIDYVDYEYCLRLRRDGWRIVQIGSAVLAHALGTPRTVRLFGAERRFISHTPIRLYTIVRNGLFVIGRHGMQFPRTAAEILYVLLRETVKSATVEHDRLDRLRWMARGAIDFVRGRFGPAPMKPSPSRFVCDEERVSVCIPTFNNASMVADAIRSARSQTHRNLEILVLDNHSTDATPDVVTEAAGDDVRIRTIRHSANLGMAGNFNAALNEATGDLVLILCADDVIAPTCVSTLAEALRRQPDCVLAACARQIVGPSLEPWKVLRPCRGQRIVSGPTMARDCFALGNLIGEPSAVLFRKADAVGGFRADFSQAIDLDLWLRLLQRGSAFLIGEPLASIRRHPSQMSETNLRSGRVVTDKRRLFQEYAPRLRPFLGLAHRWRWDLRMASSEVKAGLGKASSKDAVFYPRLRPWLLGVVSMVYRAAGRLPPTAVTSGT